MLFFYFELKSTFNTFNVFLFMFYLSILNMCVPGLLMLYCFYMFYHYIIFFIASHRSHSTHFSPCNAGRTSFHLRFEPHLFWVSPHYLTENVHFSSINNHTVHTYTCSYIYILLLLYIFQSQKRIYNPAYLRGWHVKVK